MPGINKLEHSRKYNNENENTFEPNNNYCQEYNNADNLGFHPTQIDNFIERSESDFEKSILKEFKLDPYISKIESMKELDKDRITDFLKAAKNAEQSLITKALRIAQKIMTLTTRFLIPILGWGVILLSFFAIFTDPSQTLALLSILKGVGLGCAILYLGPVLPNLLKKLFAWLEIKWVQSYFKKEANKDHHETVKNLKEWYHLMQHQSVQNYFNDIKDYQNAFSNYDSKRSEKQYSGLLNWLFIQSRKIKHFLNAKTEINSPLTPGGKLFLEYLKV